MISFEAVTDTLLGTMGFRAEDGGVLKIITGSAFESARLLRLMAGLERPEAGRITIAGDEITSLPQEGVLNAMKGVGLVPADGGTISNLKVWENIMLPSMYHSGLSPHEAEPEVLQLYERTGRKQMKNFLTMSAGPLPLHEKVIVGIVRTIIRRPMNVIYESIMEAMTQKAASAVAGILMDFHRTEPQRTSVFISASEESLEAISADHTVYAGGAC